jgi:hypothetical protein
MFAPARPLVKVATWAPIFAAAVGLGFLFFCLGIAFT